MKFYNVGKLVRKAREAKKLSQREIGLLVGLDCGAQIGNIERGQASIPKKELIKYVDVLGLCQKSVYSAMLKDFRSNINKYFTNI